MKRDEGEGRRILLETSRSFHSLPSLGSRVNMRHMHPYSALSGPDSIVTHYVARDRATAGLTPFINTTHIHWSTPHNRSNQKTIQTDSLFRARTQRKERRPSIGSIDGCTVANQN